MNIGDRHKVLALALAALTFGLLVGVLHMRNWVPFVAAGAVWLGVILATAEPAPRKGPGGATDRKGKRSEDQAIRQLGQAAKRLNRLARKAPRADVPLFERMSVLMQSLHDHHVANPSHVRLTAKFRRHVLGRMIALVTDYVDLSKRVGKDQKARLSDVSRQLEAFVPALEKIDQACIDNDLTALEINVDVLKDQLSRRSGP